MTHLTEQDIRRLARLARLELPENELGPVRDKLNAVIALIDRLQAVDTGSVAAMSHPHYCPNEVSSRPGQPISAWLKAIRAPCSVFRSPTKTFS
ncbi:MAG: aspartyl/glutamyl-tRNA amidotransferase subunit C [Betaproteobacteria bacterium]|nr:aspartyl/glutamyl-tRNA amidotransferase subunit C [Betaproteobacteria bacterium]